MVQNWKYRNSENRLRFMIMMEPVQNMAVMQTVQAKRRFHALGPLLRVPVKTGQKAEREVG
jgi:hypothetical protein